jgi:Domain of unknown function (DUF6457)
VRRDQWLAEFAERLGLDRPTKEEVKRVLDLAGTAAHSSERTAAPIACWLAGRTDRSFDELDEIAGSISAPADDA